MKKILSLSLSLLMVISQPLNAMQAPATASASASAAEWIYWGLKGTAQATWWAGSGILSVGANVVGRAASDLGLPGLAQEAAGVSTSLAKKTAGTAATVSALAIGGAAAVYAAYWLYGAKPRQDLKELKKMLAPEIPTVEAGFNAKSKYRIYNWKLAKYETAGQLARIRENSASFTNFINELAEDVINNEFKDIDSNVCLDSRGQRLSGLHGRKLTQEAANRILLHIQKEKPILENVLETLKGNYSLEKVKAELDRLMSKDVMNPNKNEPNVLFVRSQPEVGKHTSYISGDGIPLKQWLGLGYFGLKGNTFAFNYAEELKNACKVAGMRDGVVTKPCEWTPEQDDAIEKYMQECAMTRNNKIKYLRGHVHYAQAARLYWRTYKQLHRLEVIEKMLNTAMHGLPVGGQSATIFQANPYGYQVSHQQNNNPLYPRL